MGEYRHKGGLGQSDLHRIKKNLEDKGIIVIPRTNDIVIFWRGDRTDAQVKEFAMRALEVDRSDMLDP